MISSKDRKNSGRYTPKATCSPKELKENNIIINEEYDDWKDHRDSMRDKHRDYKIIKETVDPMHCHNCFKRHMMNIKQKKLLKRREARKKNE
jgi:hypothetical protein